MTNNAKFFIEYFQINQINRLYLLIGFNNQTEKSKIFKIVEFDKMQNREEKDYEEQPENWEEMYKVVNERLTSIEHEHKKSMLEVEKDLQFERKRAQEYEEKYKSMIKYKDEEEELKKILNELTEKLKSKQNQILEFIKNDQANKRKISELDNQTEELIKELEENKNQLSQIQEAAITAIVEKDNLISELEDKLRDLESIDVNGLQGAIIDLEDKLRQTQDKMDAEKTYLESIIEGKQQQLKEINHKIIVQRQKFDQKLISYDQQIQAYEKHIEAIKQERHLQQSLEQKFYEVQEKYRKSQNKFNELQSEYKQQRQGLLSAINKLEQENSGLKDQSQELKVHQQKVREQEKQIKIKTKENEDLKAHLQKVKFDYVKKITQLEHEKKKIQQSLDIKTQELERTRIQLQESKNQVQVTQEEQKMATPEKQRPSLANELDSLPLKTPKRQSVEEKVTIIEKLQARIKDLEENIESLNQSLTEQTNEVHALRGRLIDSSGSGARTQKDQERLVQIENLNTYVKKVEHNLMITKLKYAQDESYWHFKQIQLKKQNESLLKKSKKQKAELLERINRMKKQTNAKDKKTDYYQSSLK